MKPNNSFKQGKCVSSLQIKMFGTHKHDISMINGTRPKWRGEGGVDPPCPKIWICRRNKKKLLKNPFGSVSNF